MSVRLDAVRSRFRFGVNRSASEMNDGGIRFSQLALLGIFTIYLLYWAYANAGLLFDPNVQADDVRTSLFPMHQYGPEHALQGDLLAEEMLSFVPPIVHTIYRALIPITGVFWASKVVQGMALGIILWSFILLLRSRAGLAGAILLVFFLLHTPVVFYRGISGGLPRAFAFPLFALWAAAAISHRTVTRYIAIFFAALLYPPAMLMLLGAEGLFTVIPWFLGDDGELWKRLKHYGVVVGVTLLLMLPYFLGRDNLGPIHSLEEAQEEPAFGRDGRLRVLPFRRPIIVFPKHAFRPFLPTGVDVWTPKFTIWPEGRSRLYIAAIPLLILSALVILRQAPFPRVSFAFIGACIILFFIARLLAFKLYSPERFYSFGLVMGTIIFVTEIISTMESPRASNNVMWVRRREKAAIGMMILVALMCGLGTDSSNNGMTISRYPQAGLYEFSRSLPTDAKFAGHPHDTDDVRYWAARPATEGFETLQPWFKEPWARQKASATALLFILYSRSRHEVIGYLKENEIDYLLLRRSRYEDDFREKAQLFEPFNSMLDEHLRGVRKAELVLAHIPPEAIAYEEGDLIVVSTKGLTKRWSEDGA